MARCFVTRLLPGDALQRLVAAHDVMLHPPDAAATREQLLAGVAAAEWLLCTLSDAIDVALLDAAPRLRVVSN